MSLLLKPILNMAHAMPGARAWKERLGHVQRAGDCTGLHEAIRLIDSACVVD